MADIFISYARADEARVRVLAEALEAEGFSVWWDRSLDGGQGWMEEIQRQLTEAKAVLVAWSSGAAQSHWVKEEILFVLEEEARRDKLVPLQLDGTRPGFGIKSIHAENFIDWAGDRLADCWDRLMLRAQALVPEPSGPVPTDSRVPQIKPGAARTWARFLPTLLSVVALVVAFAGDLGVLGGVVAFAGGVFLLFRAADTELPAQMQALAARWLLPVKQGARVPVAEAFYTLFEAVFGERHLSVKCLWRSMLASVLALVVIVATAWAALPAFRLQMEGVLATGALPDLIRNMILLTLATNLLGDYVSLWQTRIFLRGAARTPALTPVLVVADALLTGVVFLAVLFGAFFLSQDLFQGLFELDWGGEVTPAQYFQSVLPFSSNLFAWSPEHWIFVFSVLTTYVTSLWLWLVVAFGPLAKLLLNQAGRVSAFGRLLGAQAQPFSALGLLLAVAILGVGVPVAGQTEQHLAAQAPLLEAKPFRSGMQAGAVFKDCPDCPEMVVLPAGSFQMGSEHGDLDEFPVREVTIPARFAVGRFEVTWSEWQACVAEGGCTKERVERFGGDEGWGRGRRPVINVPWEDAKAYVAWLSEETGHTYRLLSEAEWEYAARAGTTTPYSTGETITSAQANFRGDRFFARTVPVGSYAPNAFGLYDMHGNVLEWVEDCWNESYKGVPTDGSAWVTGECGRRVLRGGSWSNLPQNLRSSDRNWTTSGLPFNYGYGFRVSRTF